jgi:hypothetical protein
MAKNFISDIEGSIKNKEAAQKTDLVIPEQKSFSPGKKKADKTNKKTFLIRIDDERNERLDKLCKRTGYSKNELMLKMIDFCLDNLKLES